VLCCGADFTGKWVINEIRLAREESEKWEEWPDFWRFSTTPPIAENKCFVINKGVFL
jgi:hypothetical protein